MTPRHRTSRTSVPVTRFSFASRALPSPDVPERPRDLSIVYVSCGREVDARADLGPGDLYVVPFADKAGGPATKLAGASTAEFEENYPSFAPDDAFVAFTRVPAGGNMLFNEKKEIAVVASTGGTATRLTANDPPACTGKPGPTVANTFAKWAPTVAKDPAGNRYYWLVFSSTREWQRLEHAVPHAVRRLPVRRRADARCTCGNSRTRTTTRRRGTCSRRRR